MKTVYLIRTKPVKWLCFGGFNNYVTTVTLVYGRMIITHKQTFTILSIIVALNCAAIREKH